MIQVFTLREALQSANGSKLHVLIPIIPFGQGVPSRQSLRHDYICTGKHNAIVKKTIFDALKIIIVSLSNSTLPPLTSPEGRTEYVALQVLGKKINLKINFLSLRQ